MTAPLPYPAWADPAGEAPQTMQTVLRACVPYYGALHALLVPLRTDALTERGWQAAVALLDARPCPAETDGPGWVTRWRTFVGLVWDTVAKDTDRRTKMARATRAQAVRGKTKTVVDWGGLL